MAGSVTNLTLSYEQIASRDLSKDFREHDELVFLLTKKQADLLKASWRRYEAYVRSRLGTPSRICNFFLAFFWTVTEFYSSLRFSALPQISALYVSEGDSLLPVEFNNRDSNVMAIHFRKKAVFSNRLTQLTQSAEDGDATAQYNLGVVYADGMNVTKDSKAALKWHTLAANQGLREAQYALGWMYGHGEGTAKDENQALSWFLKAAEGGQRDAQKIIAKAYMEGLHGLEQDLEKAEIWNQKLRDKP